MIVAPVRYSSVGFGFSHGENTLGLDLGTGVHGAAVGVGYEAAHHRDALDELGNALQEKQNESDQDQRLCRPLRKSTGIHGLLVEIIGSEEERHRGDDHDDRQRQQEEEMT